jgi:hypothetical protein
MLEAEASNERARKVRGKFKERLGRVVEMELSCESPYPWIRGGLAQMGIGIKTVAH